VLAAGLDAAGKPLSWIHRIASPAIGAQFGPLRNGIDGSAVEGARNLPYHIPNVRVTYAQVELPITLWFWRSVGSSLNAWVTECFVDELATAAGKDPVAYRLELLSEHPRYRRVLETAAREAGWGTALPDGRARGVAVHESFGSIVAEVAEVSVGSDGTPRVHRVVCAVDCGDVVNPEIIKAQMESGIVYGLSAALWGELTIEGGGVKQGNFDTYPVLRIDQMPRVDTFIVTSGDPLGGIGEPGTPPIAPAVCNALYQLTGKRIRRLPIGRVV
jgi:isoquinoline 1-oxidoreductase beta subunit